jgi:hypothetical protein
LNYIIVSPSSEVRTAAGVVDGRKLILENVYLYKNVIIPLIVIFVSPLYELHGLQMFGGIFLTRFEVIIDNIGWDS